MEPKNEMMDYNGLLKTFAVSVVCAISAFIFVFFFSNYPSLFFAYDFDIPASLSLEGMSFPTGADSHSWSRDAMITILLSKPISAFIMGIVFLFILMLETKKPVSVILLLFWLNVFAFNSAFGILIDDAIAGEGTYEVAAAMNIDNVYLIMMSIILAFVLYKIGMMNGRLIMLSFPDQKLFSQKPRTLFFVAIFLIPWLFVVVYTCFSRDAVFSFSGILKNLPAMVLLIPFLTARKPENSKFKYLPAGRFAITDMILTALLMAISIVLVLVMKNGLVIHGQ